MEEARLLEKMYPNDHQNYSAEKAKTRPFAIIQELSSSKAVKTIEEKAIMEDRQEEKFRNMHRSENASALDL